ncbi:MAG TPA: hypothetical protein VF110_05900 [Burkholderiales bacterium]|jgi:hypothetical protein
MRTEQLWSLCGALAVLAQILVLGSLPYPVSGPAADLWHFLSLSAVGLLLWVAFDGNRFLRRR